MSADYRDLRYFEGDQFTCTYRAIPTPDRDYRLRLNDALARECRSNKLLELKKKWETGEYDNDWSEYEERKADHKADVSFLLFIP